MGEAMPRRTGAELSLVMGMSFFALSLVGLFALFPPPAEESPPWGKALVGAAFSLVCVLGMIAVFFPAECSKAIGHGRVRSSASGRLEARDSKASVSDLAGIRLVHGHHPPCDRFRAHEFNLGEKSFCAGCIGLLVGAFCALIGTALYFFAGYTIGQSAYPLFIVPGILGVLVSLLQFHILNVQHTAVRLVISSFFVLATFLTLVGLDMLLNSFILDLLVILFSLFWLYTKISLSNWDHERICSLCGASCELRTR